jgi:hypothetical protein
MYKRINIEIKLYQLSKIGIYRIVSAIEAKYGLPKILLGDDRSVMNLV